MLSRSAIVKLKAILIIDLCIIAAAAGAYFYLQNEGFIAGAEKPAAFMVTDLTVDPPEVFAGEAVQIAVNLTNYGDLEGNVTIDFLINGEVKNSQNLTVSGRTNQTVEFTDLEFLEGTFNVEVANLTSSFLVKTPPPDASKIVLSELRMSPTEAWTGDPVTANATAYNPTDQADKLFIRLFIDDALVASQTVSLEAGETKPVSFAFNATTEGRHPVKMNTLSGSYTVVKTGYHTLIINRSGGGSKPLPFTLNGEAQNTPFNKLMPLGEYTVSVPSPYNVGTGVVEFTYWSDGSRSSTRSFTLTDKMALICTYTVISGYASCPSLYIWNGTGYSYVTDVSNPGWLGYLSHINSDGTIIAGGGNPYDYVKLDRNLLAAKNGAFDITLAQQWDELYYLDSAYLLVVDHPAGTDVHTTLTNYLNQGETGKIYTVNDGALLVPLSAVNEKSQNVLEQIRTKDGWYTPGINGIESTQWDDIQKNVLTLNLGDLKDSPNVKLIITAMVDWGSADTYYKYLDMFKAAAASGVVPDGTALMPAPYMEIQYANGSWIRAPQERQIPIPSDYNARTFAVDLTGLFPEDITDYKVRFSNFWNVTYDYIGIDTTANQPVTTTIIKPSSAVMSQWWETNSTSTGAFTRYGDVTPLMQETDDMFVIGRQGDQVNMQFPTANLSEPAEGMVRDYIFVVACWFKDPPGAWGYGFTWTVAPMPFLAMSGFPYGTNESYPYDAEHLAYIAQYNTRIIS
ncbi:MAG: hypothetical protein NWE93_04960 [Candidatus Bathyarchaeota archaeon]|nr:hypothetical protein [Candidatus Bathyarchaeota archaeon]